MKFTIKYIDNQGVAWEREVDEQNITMYYEAVMMIEKAANELGHGIRSIGSIKREEG